MTGKVDGLTNRMRSRMTEARLGRHGPGQRPAPRRGGGAGSELDHERSEREEMRDLLRARPKTVKVRGRRPMLRVVVIGAGAYVLGARAGRERYDESLAWARSLRDRVQDRAGDVAGGMGDQVQAAATDARAKAEAIGGKVQDRAADVATRVQDRTREVGDRVDLSRSEVQTRG